MTVRVVQLEIVIVVNSPDSGEPGDAGALVTVCGTAGVVGAPPDSDGAELAAEGLAAGELAGELAEEPAEALPEAEPPPDPDPEPQPLAVSVTWTHFCWFGAG